MMKNHKQLLADFYLELLAIPKATHTNNFENLRYEVLNCLVNELGESHNTIHRIFERMAAEDARQ